MPATRAVLKLCFDGGRCCSRFFSRRFICSGLLGYPSGCSSFSKPSTEILFNCHLPTGLRIGLGCKRLSAGDIELLTVLTGLQIVSSLEMASKSLHLFPAQHASNFVFTESLTLGDDRADSFFYNLSLG